MKLYNCTRGSYIKVSHDPTDYVYYFETLDGMYSTCRDINNNIIHLAAWTNVKVVNKEEYNRAIRY